MSDKFDSLNIDANSSAPKVARFALQLGSAIPVAGSLLSALAGAWSESEQERVNAFYKDWLNMLQDELKEKEQTILEIMSRINLLDESINKRIDSPEYQSLLRKTFREWAGAESFKKREYIRNMLSNAACIDNTSDDVIRLFIDWINQYSEIHFQVIAAIYNTNGISRGEIWGKIGKNKVREDSADADLYRLLFRDLSTGGIIRQHREVDYHGNFLKSSTSKNSSGNSSNTMESAFDRIKKYELTALGQQFIHYAMTELPIRISFNEKAT